MEAKKALSINVVVVILALIILFPLGYSVVCSVFAQGTEDVEPFLETPGGERCILGQDIEDVATRRAFARFRHFELLEGCQEDAARKGIRGNVSFNSCRECHPSRERFCDRCHEAVNLRPNCFRCHYYPEPGLKTED